MEVYDTFSFQQRLDGVLDRIAAAAARAGRDPADVRLVAVSKTFPPEAIDAALRAGVSILGENRVQEALAKAALCGSAEWHLVGRLQRNKVRHALSLFTTIHSVDTIPLLHDIARVQEETGCRPRLLLEVNVAGESSKIGFNPKLLIDALRVIDDEKIDIYYMNPKAPCFIRDEEQSYIYLILPVNFIDND